MYDIGVVLSTVNNLDTSLPTCPKEKSYQVLLSAYAEYIFNIFNIFNIQYYFNIFKEI